MAPGPREPPARPAGETPAPQHRIPPEQPWSRAFFIVIFIFIWSLFSDKVHIYEVHNTGGWYNLGYLLGVMAFFGGGGGGACKRSGRS